MKTERQMKNLTKIYKTYKKGEKSWLWGILEVNKRKICEHASKKLGKGPKQIQKQKKNAMGR